MFPEPIRKALEAVGVSESSLDRVRLAQGVVGKSSHVAVAAFLGLTVVAYSLKDSGYLFAIGMCIAVMFLFYLISIIWFAHKHPDLALLEGAELVKWRQIDIAAKGIPLPPVEENKVIGGGE